MMAQRRFSAVQTQALIFHRGFFIGRGDEPHRSAASIEKCSLLRRRGNTLWLFRDRMSIVMVLLKFVYSEKAIRKKVIYTETGSWQKRCQ